MNPRIFEWVQAQNGFRGLPWTEQDKAEFAELIAHECAQRCSDIAARILADEDPFSAGKKAGALECALELRRLCSDPP